MEKQYHSIIISVEFLSATKLYLKFKQYYHFNISNKATILTIIKSPGEKTGNTNCEKKRVLMLFFNCDINDITPYFTQNDTIWKGFYLSNKEIIFH